MESVINKQIRILLVDDEPFILGLTERILATLGYDDVDKASNGNNALVKLVTSQKPYKLIICDMNMPEMDGVEFMRRAQEAHYSGGFILLSAEDSRILETAFKFASAQHLNILGVLPKPLKPDALERLLSEFCSPQHEKTQQEHTNPISEEELISGIRSQASHQLILLYQPKVQLGSGNITGVETLVRWEHPQRGILEPDTFLPIAKQAGLQDELFRKIYRTTLQQAAEWKNLGLELINTITLPLELFENSDFASFVITAAETAGVDPAQLILGFTENEFMSKPVESMEIMMRLRLKRFPICIDNFGTGDSSMSQLKSMPVTELKIRNAFATGVIDNAGARAILEASVALAKNLDMDVVAEGARSREDWDMAVELGVDYVQGSYCASPISGEEIVSLLKDWKGPN